MVPSAEDAMDTQRPLLVGITVIRAVQTHSGTAVAKIVKLGASFTGVILIVEVVVAIRDPPVPVFPRSFIRIVSVLLTLLLLIGK